MSWVSRMENDGKKRIFLSLVLGAGLFYALVFLLIWYVICLDSPELNRILTVAFLSAAVVIILSVSAGMVFLVLSLLKVNLPPKLSLISRSLTDFFSPAVFRLAKMLGISEEAVSDSYIKLINQLNSQAGIHYKPENVLILAPHCLQKADCPYKITVDAHNCHHCGRCSIDGLLKIADERGVKLAVASGGTFARKAIKDRHPEAVVAIACYRDLFSGMRDMKKMPIIGVLNERPNGPCYNTTVELCRVNQALDCFLEDAEDILCE